VKKYQPLTEKLNGRDSTEDQGVDGGTLLRSYPRDTGFENVRRSESFLGDLNLFFQAHKPMLYKSNRRLVASGELEILWKERIAISSKYYSERPEQNC
jgi:hypothetical protein